jgi:hypothetical protein
MIGSVQGKGRAVSVESESEPQTSDRQYLSAEELFRSYFSDDQLLKVIQRSTSSLIREAGEELYRRARDRSVVITEGKELEEVHRRIRQGFADEEKEAG